MASELDIINSALLRLQVAPIADLTGTQKARTCAAIFTENWKMFLSAHDWNFGRKTEQLSPTTSPDPHWLHAFDIPGDLIGEPVAIYATSAENAAPMKNWTRMGNQVLTQLTPIWMTYKYQVPFGNWPDYFATLVRMSLCVDFAEPFTEDASKRDRWQTETYGLPSEYGQGGYYRIARQIDAKGEPSPRIQDFSLINARFGAR